MDILIVITTQVKKFFLTLIITPILLLFMPVNHLIQPLLWLVFIDIITGMYVAKRVEKKDLTSRGFLQKLLPITLFFIAVAAALLSGVFFQEFGIEKLQPAKWVCAFYAIYELFSILENLGKSGLPVAKQIAAFLKTKLPNEVNPDKQNTEENKPQE
jgi:phage-related holin